MNRIISAILITLVFISTIFYCTPFLRAEAITPPPTPASSIILRNIEVYLDGLGSPLNYAAFIDVRERAAISLDDCSLIFGTQIEIIDTRLLLRKGSLEFFIEQDDYLQLPPTKVNDNSEPLLNLAEFYLPMRFVAEQLGYEINYNSRAGAVVLRSPDYAGPDPDFVPPAPPSFPADLPAWGNLATAPVIAELWPTENIIAAYYTSLGGSPASRSQNIVLSCAKLNGTIIEVEELGSFNHTVGERTAAAGYQSADIIVGKSVVPGIGGGICQAATTLYNSVLEANLTIVERHPHTLPVSYIPINQDATVSWGSADLKFVNNLPHPIKILSQVYSNYVIFAIAAIE